MELLQGGTRRLTGETDNLALGYQTTADGHPSAQVADAAVDAVVQAFNNVNVGEGPNKVNRESIRSDLAEGAKIGNDPRNRFDLLLVKGVTGSLGAEGSRARTNYFLYDAAKSANTHPVGQQP